jgi:hypothetical protein
VRHRSFALMAVFACTACLDFNKALQNYCPPAADGGATSCDFSLTFDPTSVSVTAGGSASVQMTLVQGTYTGSVSVLVASGSLPAHVTATSATLSTTATTGSLTFSADSSAPPLSFVATVTAVGDTTKTFSVPVTVIGLGNLAVAIDGAPAGSTPDISVTGPSGYSMTLHSGQTLSGLSPGSYLVTAAPIRGSDTIVATLYDGTISGSTVVTAQSTANVTVTFAPRPGTGHLWVVDNSSDTLFGFSSSQLHTTYPPDAGSIFAAVQIGIDPTNFPAPWSVAFDPMGDLWVSAPGSGIVYHYGKEQLAASSSVLPARIQVGAADPLTIAFDSSGNLWIADGSLTKTLYEAPSGAIRDAGYFSADGGVPNVAPQVTIQVAPPFDFYNTFIAFDQLGNLFVTRCDFDSSGFPIQSTSRLLKLSPGQLTSSATSLTPSATIYATDGVTDGGLANPQGIAIDGSGNAWISNFGWNNNGLSPQVVELGAAELRGASGTTTIPTVARITSKDFVSPAGVVLDESGGLWISNLSAATVLFFPADAITRSGSYNLVPSNILPTMNNGQELALTGIAFGPSAPGLPLVY